VRTHVLRCLAAVCAACLPSWSTAAPPAPLADPTRPPGMAAPAAAPPGAARGAAQPRPAAPPPALPMLQAIQLPEQGPATAMVDGRLVTTGDRIGERVVVAIDRQGLLMGGKGGSDRLWLLTGEAKQPPGTIAETRSARIVPAVAPAAVAAATPSETVGATERERAPTASASTIDPPPDKLSLAGRTTP